jgi:hypothetical protein
MTGRAALLLAWLLSPASAIAEAAPSDPLRGLLSQYEGLPDAEKFRARLADPVEALLRLSVDATAPAWLRLRAVDALTRFPEPAVREHLEARLDTEARAPARVASPEAHAELAVYLRTFPTVAAARLRAALRHPDPELRATALRVAEGSPEHALRVEAAAHLARQPGALEAVDRAGGSAAAPTLR